jgi:hypothetical protein
MMMKTEKAHEIRMYYISLEKIVKAYVKYQEEITNRNHQLVIRNQELALRSQEQETARLKQQVEEMKALQTDLAKMAINTTPIKYTEYVYVLTSKRYYRLSLFKVGMTTDPKSRLVTYNTGNALEDDEHFYACKIATSDARGLEKQMHRVLESYRFNREWFRIRPRDMLRLVKFVSKQQDALLVHVNALIANQQTPKDALDIDEFMKLIEAEVDEAVPDAAEVAEVAEVAKVAEEAEEPFMCAQCREQFEEATGFENHLDQIHGDVCAIAGLPSGSIPLNVLRVFDPQLKLLRAPGYYSRKVNICPSCRRWHHRGCCASYIRTHRTSSMYAMKTQE